MKFLRAATVVADFVDLKLLIASLVPRPSFLIIAFVARTSGRVANLARTAAGQLLRIT